MTWEYICRVNCFDTSGVKTLAYQYRCPVCGFVHTCIENHGMYDYCPQCGKKNVLTNEEWLRTLPDDERVKEVLSHGFMTEKRTAEEFVKWLKEKHNE